MVNILRVKARWSGFSGAPGYTVFHFRDFSTGEVPGAEPDQSQANGAVIRVQTFFLAIRSGLPSSVSINYDEEVDMLEDTTGELVNSFTPTPVAATTGSSAVAFSGPVGAVVNWRTNSIRNGRRIRGRSFIVPLTSGVFATNGGLLPAYRTQVQDAATALVERTGTPDLGVYARPTGPGATDGMWVAATTATVPSMGAVLRSRRD